MCRHRRGVSRRGVPAALVGQQRIAPGRAQRAVPVCQSHFRTQLLWIAFAARQLTHIIQSVAGVQRCGHLAVYLRALPAAPAPGVEQAHAAHHAAIASDTLSNKSLHQYDTGVHL